ncbi:ubiquinol-cytochrome c reductase iron-sulfur subunit [Chryseolinea lacunae]|uniref:Rieske (2Fe-2S) protein n=1 Tax=Chryseolinea lacunae TaxID=2801331 RepID=A0ABS1KXF2_9BACT|nr:Rieske (2Fe-2S) protein [Chryseolinea lacunae]MBL0744084.1 Rieske (2Fe-2S) protein [Chryseolinea lacunae]
MKTRREFLKDTCTTCLGTVALGFTFSQLSSCSSLPVFKANLEQKTVTVPLTSFAESNLVIVRDMQVQFDILLVKKSAEEYNALHMKCSHRDNPVSATKSGLYCPEHGSTFDLDGNVTKEPAPLPLKKFKTTLSDQNITIDLNS